MWTCESVQQLSNLNTSNRYWSSALSEFSSSSFSVSTQEPRPTQMSVARQLRNIAACNGQTGGKCLYCESPCHFYSSWSEATSDHWSCSESVEDKSSAVWNQGPLSSVFSSLLQMTSRHFLYFCLSSSFSPWYQRLTGRQPQAILHTTSHCFGSSSDLKFPPGQ